MPRATKTSTKEQVREDKVYELIHYHPRSYALKSGRGSQILISKYNGKPLQYPKAIRHCPGEKSIFKEEQSKEAEVAPIIFIKGFFEAKGHETITQDFLDNHPKNGVTFRLVDEAADAEEYAELEELRMDAKAAVRKKAKEEGGIELLRMVVTALTSDAAEASRMSPGLIKTTLYDLIDNNVSRFTNDKGEITIFEDQDIVRGALAKLAFKSGVVEISGNGNSIIWEDNKSVICHVPEGAAHEDFFAEFLGTNEGVQVAREVNKRL